MVQTSACPSHEQLEAYLLGKVTEADLAALEQHLSQCSACLSSVQQLNPQDAFIETMRSRQTAADSSIERIDPGLIAQLCQLQHSTPVTDEGTIAATPLPEGKNLSIESTFEKDAAKAGESTQESFHFLSPPQQPDEIGRLGDYRILKVLGTGGMGIVFGAEDSKLQRLVALKVMKPSVAEKPEAKKRFLREARAAAKVKNDHIITIHQVDEAAGVPFLAMEFLEGMSLDQLLKGKGYGQIRECEAPAAQFREGEAPAEPLAFANVPGSAGASPSRGNVPGSAGASPSRVTPLTVAEILRIGREIALGLAAAHDRGLIHRDIKPGNIWLESVARSQWSLAENATDQVPRTTDYRVKILDFGLARLAASRDREGGEDLHLTGSGVIVGTPAYMAPEQADGKNVDHRCDLFSLGCVLYRMCTGKLPFHGDTTMAILRALAVDEPRPVNEFNPQIPVELSDVIMRLLAKDPKERPESALQVVQMIETIEGHQPALDTDQIPACGLAPDSTPTVEHSVPDDAAAAISAIPQAAAAKRTRRLVFVAAALVFAFLAVFATVQIFQATYRTPYGTFVVEINGNEVEARFKNGKILLYDKNGKLKYTLSAGERNRKVDPGEYTIDVKGADGLELSTKRFRIGDGKQFSVQVLLRANEVAGKGAKGNYALEFDGKRSFVDIPSLKYDGSHPITIEATATPSQITSGGTLIGDSDLGGITLSAGITFYRGKQVTYSNKEWNFLTWNNANYAHCFSKLPVAANKTVHLAGVYDGKTSKLFVDGRLVATAKAQGQYKPSVFPLMVGANPSTREIKRNFHFPGIIDEVRISKIARYTKEFTPAKRFEPDKHTVALYHFDEGKGEKLIDSSGNGHHGKIVGAKWVRVADTINLDRRAAEWALALGGYVRVIMGDKLRQVESLDDLPKQPFQLNFINIRAKDKNVDNVSIANLSQVTALSELFIFDSALNDEGINQLATISGLSDLTRLVLTNCRITDNALPSLQRFQKLRTLDVSGNRITDLGLKHINKMPSVQNLNLSSTHITNEGLKELQAMKKLRSLDLLGNRQITDEGLVHIGAIKTLHYIRLQYLPITDQGLRHLRNLANIESLLVGNTQINGVGLKHLKSCKNLINLDLGRTAIRDEQLVHLKPFTKLQRLTLYQAKLSDNGLRHLVDLKNLRELILIQTKIGDPALEHLKKIKTLRVLDLTRTKVTVAGVAALQKALPKCNILWDGNTDPDRRAAEFVLSIGGTIRMNGEEKNRTDVADLPKDPFKVTYVNLQFSQNLTEERLALVGHCMELTHLYLARSNVTDAGLAQFDNCKELTLLELRRTAVTDAGLVHLKELKKLAHLDLSSTKVTAAGVAALQKALPKCKITWDGNTAADRRAAEWVIGHGGIVDIQEGKTKIVAIADLPKKAFHVSTIHLNENQRVSDADMQRLQNLKKLQRLYVFQTKISDEGIKQLPDMLTLEVLDLGWTKVTDRALLEFKRFPNLKYVSLANTKVTNQGLAHLKKSAPGLVSLPLDNCPITDAGLVHLVQLKLLELLNLSVTKVTDEGMKHLSQLPRLKTLHLVDTCIGDAGVKQLASSTHMQRLSLSGTSITNSALRSVAKLTNLVDLRLSKTQVTDAGLEHLTGLQKLTDLWLHETKVTDAGAAHIAKLKNLVQLHLHGTKISDGGLQQLKGLKKLAYLSLDRTNISDLGLAHLSAFPKLSSLMLRNTQISDEGLKHLHGLKNLKQLDFTKVRVTAAGVAALQKALPKCKIIWGGNTDADRRAAEWALANGGYVRLGTDETATYIHSRDKLPAGRLTLYTLAVDAKKAAAHIGDDSLEPLRAVGRLHYLTISHSAMTNGGLQRLTTFPGLAKLGTLGLYGARINDSGLAHLKEFSKLTRLNLDANKGITDAGVKHLRNLPGLTALSLGATSVTDKGLAELRDLRLTTLHLYMLKGVTDDGMKHLAGMTTLDSLGLEYTMVSGAGLRHLGKLTGLRTLNLGQSKVTDAGMENVNRFSKLRRLHLSGLPITNAGLAKLKLPGLETLALEGTKITDAGLGHLRSMPQLTVLHLHVTQITDNGLKDLAGCRRLTELNLQHTKVTAAGVAALQKALPKCNIIWGR